MKRWKNRSKEDLLEERKGETSFQFSNLPSFQTLMLLLAFVSIVAMLFVITLLAFAEETQPVNNNSPETKDGQSRQILVIAPTR